MPIIQDFRSTKTIELKTLEGGKVEIYSGVLFRDSKIVDEMIKKQSDPDLLLRTLAVAIKSWNFTDKEGKDLPISADTLNLLKPETISEISNELTTFINEKKNS